MERRGEFSFTKNIEKWEDFKGMPWVIEIQSVYAFIKYKTISPSFFSSLFISIKRKEPLTQSHPFHCQAQNTQLTRFSASSSSFPTLLFYSFFQSFFPINPQNLVKEN